MFLAPAKGHGDITKLSGTFPGGKAILRSAGLSHLDLLSLDVEGPELPILKVLPWDEFEIQVQVRISNKFLIFNDGASFMSNDTSKNDHISAYNFYI